MCAGHAQSPRSFPLSGQGLLLPSLPPSRPPSLPPPTLPSSPPRPSTPTVIGSCTSTLCKGLVFFIPNPALPLPPCLPPLGRPPPSAATPASSPARPKKFRSRRRSATSTTVRRRPSLLYGSKSGSFNQSITLKSTGSQQRSQGIGQGEVQCVSEWSLLGCWPTRQSTCARPPLARASLTANASRLCTLLPGPLCPPALAGAVLECILSEQHGGRGDRITAGDDVCALLARRGPPQAPPQSRGLLLEQKCRPWLRASQGTQGMWRALPIT